MFSSSSPGDVGFDASQYLRFNEPRTRPGLELLARVRTILKSPGFEHLESKLSTFVDLGCGTGRFLLPILTEFPTAKKIFACDASSSMIEKGKQLLEEEEIQGHLSPILSSKVVWLLSDMKDFPSEGREPVDFLFSNAALHWIPQHKQYFPSLINSVRPDGGIFAFQIPNNFSFPSHSAARGILEDFRKQGKISLETLENALKISGALDIPSYYEILAPYCTYLDIYSTQYFHPLEESLGRLESPGKASAAEHPVCSWLRGSYLSPILPLLGSKANEEEFLHLYNSALSLHYPVEIVESSENPGEFLQRCLFPFQRIFMIGIRNNKNYKGK